VVEDEVKGWKGDNEESHVHAKHINQLPMSQTGNRTTDSRSTVTEDHHTALVQPPPQWVSQKADEKTGNTTNPNAECAEPMTPADRSSNPPDMYAT
jgi:hypothetical protein